MPPGWGSRQAVCGRSHASSADDGPRDQAAQRQSVSALQAIENRYRDGIIIWETSENAEVPFLLRLQGTTQVRYINSLSSQETFTDHLGVTRDVNKRNDITVNRSMMVFGGYIFNKRAPYSFTVWTSAGAASCGGKSGRRRCSSPSRAAIGAAGTLVLSVESESMALI